MNPPTPEGPNSCPNPLFYLTGPFPEDYLLLLVIDPQGLRPLVQEIVYQKEEGWFKSLMGDGVIEYKNFFMILLYFGERYI